MFIAMNRIKVNPGQGDVLEERFQQFHGLEQMPGFLRFQLLKRVWSPRGGGNHEEYLAMTEWVSKQAFLDWTQSEAFKQAHANPRMDIFAAPVEPAGYHIVAEREA